MHESDKPAGMNRADVCSRTQTVMGLKTLLLLVLEVSLAASSCPGRSMPGSPCNISTDDKSLQEVVLNAAYYFNNQSNDAFLFKPSTIHAAQRQVVSGIRYIVDFEISRTVCHKRNKNDVSNCDFQPAGPLHQTFQCHLEVWMVPWRNQTETQVLSCK